MRSHIIKKSRIAEVRESFSSFVIDKLPEIQNEIVIIPNICTDYDLFDQGFSKKLSDFFPSLSVLNSQYIKKSPDISLFDITENKKVKIANIFCCNSKKHARKINYIKLAMSLCRLNNKILLLKENNNVSLHTIKIGLGFFGGDWETIKNIMDDSLTSVCPIVHKSL